jgi:hypothetical protein
MAAPKNPNPHNRIPPAEINAYLRKHDLKLTGPIEKKRERVWTHKYRQTPKGKSALAKINENRRLKRAAKGSLAGSSKGHVSANEALSEWKAKEYAYRATGSSELGKTKPAYKILAKNWVNSLTPAQRIDATAPIEMRDIFNRALRTAKGQVDKNYQRIVHHTQPFKYGGVQPTNSGYAQIIPAQQHRRIHADPKMQKLWESNQARGVRVGGVMPENPNILGITPDNIWGQSLLNFDPTRIETPLQRTYKKKRF